MGIGNNWNHYIEENSEVVLESWLLIWLMSCFQLVIDVHSINVRIILLHDIKPWTFMLAWLSFLPLLKISHIWWVHTIWEEYYYFWAFPTWCDNFIFTHKKITIFVIEIFNTFQLLSGLSFGIWLSDFM